MKYTLSDYICDYLYITDGKTFTQPYQSEDNLNWKFISIITQVNKFYETLLFCDKIIRIAPYTYSPYKVHKSYPSARSLYPLKLWVCLSKGYFITNDDKSGKYALFYNDDLTYLSPGTVLITNDEINLPIYKSIHKSLEYLEMGHLLYNLFEVYKIFGNSFIIDNSPVNFTALILKEEKDTFKVDFNSVRKKILQFKEKARYRNSGSYYSRINNLDSHRDKNFFKVELDLQEHYMSLFNKKEKCPLIVTYFSNDNNGYFVSDEIKIPYHKLNKEYNFINFRTCSQFTLISLKKDFFVGKRNFIDEIQYIGFVAQIICLNNSLPNFYNRPVKQVLVKAWNNDLLKNQREQALPIYGVISGWEK